MRYVVLHPLLQGVQPGDFIEWGFPAKGLIDLGMGHHDAQGRGAVGVNGVFQLQVLRAQDAGPRFQDRRSGCWRY